MEPKTLFPSLPFTTRGLPTILSANPAGDKIVYCNGRSVYFVPLDINEKVEIYTGHSCRTTVAKISPNGNYCASGDIKGNVRIWDTKTQVLKVEKEVFGRQINDIAWDSESKRIAIVGKVAEDFVKIYSLETGTFVRNLMGHSIEAVSVDVRSTKPFQVVSAGNDMSAVLYEGIPPKMTKICRKHLGNITCVRFSPDGSHFATAGVGGSMFIWDKDAKDPKEFVEYFGKAHFGTISALSWSPDGQFIATAGLNSSIKVFRVETRSVIENVLVSQNKDHQQLGIVWTKEALVSVALDGVLRIYDSTKPSVMEVTERCGHNKPIMCMTKSADSKFLYTADNWGYITLWNLDDKTSKRAPPLHQKTLIKGISLTRFGDLVTLALDDTLSYLPYGEIHLDTRNRWIRKLPSEPCGFAVSSDGKIIAVACLGCLEIWNDGKTTQTQVDYEPLCISASFTADKTLVAVGAKDQKMRVYELIDGVLELLEEIEFSSEIVQIEFSENGEYLLIALQVPRKLIVYYANNFNLSLGDGWCRHTGLIKCVAWSPDNIRVASGSLDRHIYVYNVKKPLDEPFQIPNAHISDVNALIWINSTTLASAGEDSNVKIWEVPF